MTIEERKILFKLADTLKRVNTAPLSTFTPYTGQAAEPKPYQAATAPLPLTLPPKP